MRILYVLDQALPSQYHFHLLRHLHEDARHEVHLFNFQDVCEFNEQIRNVVASVVSLQPDGRTFGKALQILTVIRSLKPAIVHAHDPVPTFHAALARIFSKFEGKLLYHRHHLVTVGGKMRFCDRFAVRFASKVLTESRAAMVKAYEENSTHDGKIQSLWNGLDLDADLVGDEALAIPERRIKILLRADAYHDRGMLVVLQAFKNLQARYSDAGLYMVGQGTMDFALKEKVMHLGLENDVFFLGRGDAIGSLVKKMDLVIAPSQPTAFCFGAVEAMAAGKLVLAADSGCAREIVQHRETGILYDPLDVDSLTAHLVQYISNGDKRRLLAREGLRRYQMYFTAKKFADGVMQEYDALSHWKDL